MIGTALQNKGFTSLVFGFIKWLMSASTTEKDGLESKSGKLFFHVLTMLPPFSGFLVIETWC